MDISDTFLKTFQCELYYITPVANIMPQCISEIKKISRLVSKSRLFEAQLVE